jgi:CBS domain-containing protein
MQLKDLMVDPVPAVAEDANLRQAALLMGEQDVSVLAVLRGPDVVGTLSERDLVLGGCATGRAPDATAVSQVMTRRVTFCPLDTDPGSALRLMEEGGAEVLLVRGASSEVIGLLTRLRLLEGLVHADARARGPLPESVRRVRGNPA